MGRDARAMLGVFVVLLAFTGTPARAYPIAGPSVHLEVTATEDPKTFHFAVIGEDPDGLLTIGVCIEETATPSCRNSTNVPADPVEAAVAGARACLDGSSLTYAFDHTFASYGSYRVVATATGRGCPVLGAEETATTSHTVFVTRPGPAITCAHPGTPTATDVGVTAETIRIGATVATTGPMAVSTVPAYAGLMAALDRINRTGGICGRMLDYHIVNDGFDAQRGFQYIKNLIAEKSFALFGMPSWPGLRRAISAGTIDAARIPVVGTSGTVKEEFSDPWVWPVGTSSENYGRVMARHAYDLGARRIAIVWTDLPAGDEIRSGVQSAVSELPDAQIGGDRRVSLSDNDYGPVLADIRNQCRLHGGDCDAMILALDVTSTIKYLQAAENLGFKPAIGTMLAPSGVATATGTNGGSFIDGVVGWTGFTPPGDSAGANQYARDVLALAPSTDLYVPGAEAAYAGTMILARALGQVGVNLTRTRLKWVLDHASLDLDLTASPLTWVNGKHANVSARGREFVYKRTFAGWRDVTDWIAA